MWKNQPVPHMYVPVHGWLVGVCARAIERVYFFFVFFKIETRHFCKVFQRMHVVRTKMFFIFLHVQHKHQHQHQHQHQANGIQQWCTLYSTRCDTQLE